MEEGEPVQIVGDAKAFSNACESLRVHDHEKDDEDHDEDRHKDVAAGSELAPVVVWAGKKRESARVLR